MDESSEDSVVFMEKCLVLYCAHVIATENCCQYVSEKTCILFAACWLPCVSEMPKKDAKRQFICALCYHFVLVFNVSCKKKKKNMVRQMVKS